ncbi:rho GTPase-activating protein 20-like [Apodemus sylvaticus]|uniref:rho GTPase-activating protein 20-like n=1 Tax=Apodemus sylvaticus TaxID=10129 RepID=UPI0022444EC9|nr:rho GTPase-activating protein 20-like [Apodemus sylvaticus]
MGDDNYWWRPVQGVPQLFYTEPLVKADMGGLERTLLCQGPVELTRGTKTNRRHLSLFDDVLVVSSNLNKKKFKIKFIIPLNNLWAVDNVELVRKNEFSLCKNLFLFWPDGNFLASFRSIEEKDHWYYFIRRTVKISNYGSALAMRNLLEHCTAIHMYLSYLDFSRLTLEGSGVFSSKCCYKSCSDCSTDILSVSEEKANQDFNQIGYECPHKVLMNHLQINLGRWKSKISTAFPILPGLFVKDFNTDEERQFILKPRNSARIQQQNEKERPRKTKRPLMTSCFHRASVPHRDQMCTDPKVKKTGQLFGKQLSCICPNGKWPQGILDILYRLREKGPTTQSIFAKSPNETSCNTLKDKLDNGEVVDIKNYSLHDVAWILKEFLRRIKGSLMTAQLYDKWLAVPQKANHKEKLTAVRSLLDNLPAPNAALLGQLFRILHEISKNASFNLMSAQNLSAEIAPYILWMPTYRNKVLANYITEKISLVTFLISNSPELFGLDVVAVWYETSFFSPTSTNTSCAHNSPSIINKGKETEHGINTCPSGKTYSPGHDAPAITPVAPPLHEGNIEKGEGNVDTTRQAISKTAPAPIKKQGFRSFPPISCLDRMLPSPILDMLSIIERRGQNTDQIFRYLPGKSHWSLRDKIYTGQDIDWHEQSVITISSVLKSVTRVLNGFILPEIFNVSCGAWKDDSLFNNTI